MGKDRYNFFTESQNSKLMTILVRGGAEQFLKEAERSLNDAVMIVRRLRNNPMVVCGGGATEMQLSKQLRQLSFKMKGKEQLVLNAFAKSLEIIPKTLANNSGMEINTVIGQLR